MFTFIDVPGVFFGMGICVECMSIPGLSGMGGCCLVCAFVGSIADSTSASIVAFDRKRMVIPSLEDCVVAYSVENAGRREGQEGIRYEGLCEAEMEEVVSGV
jgi:hypothetical protein